MLAKLSARSGRPAIRPNMIDQVETGLSNWKISLNYNGNKNMRKLTAKHVSAAEGGGEYFQVMFEEGRNSDKNYFLIQRAFESEWDEFEEGEPDPPYIESDDMTFCGFSDLRRVELSRERFYIQLADERENDLEISFDISEREYQEVKEILKAILQGYDFAIIE